MQLSQGTLLFLAVLCLAATVSEGSKILILIPLPFKSHVRAFSVLIEALTRRGHEVTMVSSYPVEKVIPKYREILIDKRIYGDFYGDHNFTEWAQMSVFHTLYLRWKETPEWVSRALMTKQMQALINSNEKFDLIMSEFLMHQEAFLVFGHRFNAPLIELGPQHLPLSHSALVGNPQHFAYLPDPDLPLFERMTFLERLHNTVFGLVKLAGIYWFELPWSERIAEKCFRYPGVEKRPPLTSLIANISLVLANSHFSFHPARPYAPNIIEIGGFHIEPPKKLPADFQRFMNEAKEGVILVSFGTHIKSHMFAKEREEAFISVFKSLRQRVIWRWDNPDACKDCSNLIIKEWLPQFSILAHPNCILFLTHGGIASQMEAIHFGVPMIGFPFILDQFHNVEYVFRMGLGLKFDILQINHNNLLRAITTVLQTPSFREKMKEQSRIMRDQPQKPLDRAVFWVEYVIRHKGAHHLKPYSAYLPFYQYILMDITVLTIATLVLAVFILWKITRICLWIGVRILNLKKLHEKTH